VTPEAELDQFKRIVKEMLAAAKRANAVPDYAGANPQDMLEHNTRRIALDPLLEALGWTFNDRTEEARVVDNTTLFIDYLGIDRENRIAEFIFEAKAWDASWVAGKGKFSGRPVNEQVAAAVAHLNSGHTKNAPLTDEWMKRIDQIRKYVLGIHAKGGSVVQRAVIGSARWMIIFTDPGKAFIEGKVTAAEIVTIEEHDMVERSDEIYRLLSIDALRVAPRQPVFPDDLPLHIADAGDIQRVFRAAHVTRDETSDPWTPQPSIQVNAWLIVQRRDGAMFMIRPRDVAFTLPTNDKFIGEHFDEMEARSNAMLAELDAAYGTALPLPSPIGEFPNFANDGHGLPVKRSDTNGSNYIVATGIASHYLRPAPVVDCRFHNHETCRLAGVNDDDMPVIKRSYERKSFFITDEPHHCAHRKIKFAKKSDPPCPLAVFEEKLCCRACTLQDWCWSAEKLRLAPCGR
jgi:hypothetical protein